MEKRKRNDQHHQQEQHDKYILLKPDIWYLKWYEKKVEENDSSWNWIGNRKITPQSHYVIWVN